MDVLRHLAVQSRGGIVERRALQIVHHHYPQHHADGLEPPDGRTCVVPQSAPGNGPCVSAIRRYLCEWPAFTF